MPDSLLHRPKRPRGGSAPGSNGDGSVSSPSAPVAEEEDEPQQLGQGRGSGGYVSQSSGPQGLPGTGLFLLAQEAALMDGDQGPMAGIELDRQAYRSAPAASAEPKVGITAAGRSFFTFIASIPSFPFPGPASPAKG